MIGASAAYMSGLFFASFFTDNAALPLFLAVLIFFVFLSRKQGFKKADYIVIAVSFTAAFSVFTLYTHTRYDRIVAYDGKSGSFIGEVTDITVYAGERTRYVLDGTIDGVQPAKVIYYDSAALSQYGDLISLGSCKFSVPETTYLFDSKTYYKSQGVFLTAYGTKDIERIHTGSRKIKNRLMEYREKMISEFKQSIGYDCGSFLAGMIFGEKQGLDRNTRTSLYRSGIGHVLAVSGLHVSIAVLFFVKLLEKLRFKRIFSLAIADVFIVMIIMMANTPLSAIRAAIMMNFQLSAKIFRRQNDPLNSLSAAALFIAISDPYSIFNSGFLMSLSGTFGISVFGPYIAKAVKEGSPLWKFKRDLIIMTCTTLTVMPLSISYFDETSIISPLTNILLIPLCSAAMLIGMIYVISGGLISLLELSWLLITVVTKISDALASCGFTHISSGYGAISIISIGLAAIVGYVYLLLRNRKYTVISLLSAFFLFAFSLTAEYVYHYNELKVAVLGKGTNAAVVATHMGKTIVVDLSGGSDSAKYVRKYLMRCGITEVDAIILTEKAPSQFPAYAYNLDFVKINRWLSENEPYVRKSIYVFGDDGISLDTGSYNVEVSGGKFEVNAFGCNVSVLPVSTEMTDDGVCVYYGNVKKKDTVTNEPGVFYLDKKEENSIDNFEIILSENGTYMIRRLYATG